MSEGKAVKSYEKLKISEIKAYDKNAKIHDKDQVAQIRDSILEYGYNDPIAVDEKNEIIEGHGRLEAIKQINSDPEYEIEVIRLKGLSEKQKKKYRIAHNKINMNTGFDFSILRQDFKSFGDEFEGTGFSEDEFMANKKLAEIKEKTLADDRREVITVLPPEAPHLKERIEFRCKTKAQYDKVKKFFGNESCPGIDKLIGLLE